MQASNPSPSANEYNVLPPYNCMHARAARDGSHAVALTNTGLRLKRASREWWIGLAGPIWLRGFGKDPAHVTMPLVVPSARAPGQFRGYVAAKSR